MANDVSVETSALSGMNPINIPSSQSPAHSGPTTTKNKTLISHWQRFDRLQHENNVKLWYAAHPRQLRWGVSNTHMATGREQHTHGNRKRADEPDKQLFTRAGTMAGIVASLISEWAQ